MNEITAFETAVPAMIVGETLDDAPPPLGLGEPFALLGGDRLGPDGIPFRVLHEHQPGFLHWVRESCRECLAAERPWFRGRPALLTGNGGAGRTHAARWLARVAGVSFIILNLSDPLIATNLGASRRVSEALWASPITVAMAATRCANPVVLVVGAEEASGDVISGLASMIDPEAGACWREDQLNTIVDLGEVTWLIQAEQATRLPASLRPLVSQIWFEPPPATNETVFALSIMLEAAGDLAIDLVDPLYSWRRIMGQFDRQPRYGKPLYAAMIDALTRLRRDAISGDDDVPF